MTSEQIKEALLTCPGDTIQETIDSIGMPQRELAERLGYPSNKLNQLIKGDISLTRDMAAKLENVLGIPAGTWLELERMYQEEKLELEETARREHQWTWLQNFPLKQMGELGVINNSGGKSQQVREVLSFFQVASSTEWEQIYLAEQVSVAFKISLAHTQNPFSLSVWLRMGEIQAEHLSLEPYAPEAFANCLEAARQIAFHQPADFLEQLQTLCAKCGVAVVYTPMLPKAPVNGATRWLKKRSHPLLQLSDRYKTADHFWFAFFHEAAHILKHGKTAVFLDGVDGIQQDEEKEAEADRFALHQLLGQFSLASVKTRRKPWSETEVVQTAQTFGIHPGILVAQLQRIGSLPKANLNGLKVRIGF
ncbi:MAG TPA: helix-turn-helix domain-containing protein [Flavilitoribacter sp.]|nr:helix-turn-helix domain-containing protein [Flavilitoribacter sp.]